MAKKEEFQLQNTEIMTCCDAESEEELYTKAFKAFVSVMIWSSGLDPAHSRGLSEKLLRAFSVQILHPYQSWSWRSL